MDVFRRNMPDAFVFALVLTIIVALISALWLGAGPIEIIQSWYDGFWNLLEFGMQMILLIVTGYSIALSPQISRGIDKLSDIIKTPRQVYLSSILLGVSLSMISWGWVVIAAVFARELAKRVDGVNYPFLIACVYFSNNSWVTGLSSSIPLVLNTQNNYMIEAGILSTTIPTTYTLGSILNIAMVLLYLIGTPLIMLLLAPAANKKELKDMNFEEADGTLSIEDEAADHQEVPPVFSDKLNRLSLLHWVIGSAGLFYASLHFYRNGFDLNLNIMIFIFIMIGLLLHSTPMRYGISMRRASANVSGIIFQFPFYAGIMGIMIGTGLGERLAFVLASYANIESLPVFAYLLGGIVNFAIPSGGGEFAVIGPSVIEAVNKLGSHLPESDLLELQARTALSVAYGESLTNLLQPFYLLLVIPVMGAGIRIQARDVMGYLLIPFLVYFVIQILFITFLPI